MKDGTKSFLHGKKRFKRYARRHPGIHPDVCRWYKDHINRFYKQRPNHTLSLNLPVTTMVQRKDLQGQAAGYQKGKTEFSHAPTSPARSHWTRDRAWHIHGPWTDVVIPLWTKLTSRHDTSLIRVSRQWHDEDTIHVTAPAACWRRQHSLDTEIQGRVTDQWHATKLSPAIKNVWGYTAYLAGTSKELGDT